MVYLEIELYSLFFTDGLGHCDDGIYLGSMEKKMIDYLITRVKLI